MAGDAARSDRGDRTFAGYRLVRPLDRGGMAELFLVEKLDPGSGGARELRVLKRILPQYAESPERVALFIREVRLAITLDHPNVVRAHAFGEEAGTHWLELELVHGMDLRRFAQALAEHATQHGERYPGQRAGILPPGIVAGIGLQIARGLSYLHARVHGDRAAVIHRDVSPDNVLVDLQGRAKITDFGVSKVLVGEDDVATAHRYGKPLYAPPEQLTDQPIDRRADLYALGVVLFELLTGELPYDDPLRPNENAWGKVSRAAKTARDPIAKLPAITRLATPVPAPMLEVLERLIQGQREARPGAAEEIIGHLEQTITALGHDLPAVQQQTGELVSLVYGPPDTALDLGDTPLEEPPMSHSTKRPIMRLDAPDDALGGQAAPHEADPGTAPSLEAPSLEAPSLEAKPGTLIGRWRIVRELGKGGMGATHVVQHEEVDKRACLKLIRPEHAADPEYREQFLREAQAAAATSHPNVASLLDFAPKDSRDLWALFELVDGAPLSTILARSPHHCLPPEQVAVVALDMAHGLDHLHTPNRRRHEVIVHRDVSPQNIMVGFDGRVKLIDFGIAKILSGLDTQTNVLRGKTRYMAPELLEQEVPGPPADQWAFGVVLYLQLSGRLPYPTVYNGKPPAPLTSPLGPLDPRWTAIVSRLMNPTPSKRYASLTELIDELTPLASSRAAREELGRLVWRRAPAKSAMGVEMEELRQKVMTEVERKREEERTARAKPPPAAAGPVAPAAEPLPSTPAADASAPKPPGDLAPGTVVAGRYRIISKVGAGGMGAVYEGQHIAIKRRVAIKVVHPHVAHQPDVVGRFQREAQAATLIAHPNVVEVTDFGELADGRPFMVLEFLRGRDWEKDIEAEGPQPLGKVAHIATQVCRGLAAAHAHGIVHRDLKPENVFLLEREGDPCFAKIVDFGISKLRDAGGDGELKLTQTGMVLGTPYYMSPEQCRAQPIDHRADLYAFGAMLFRALTGTHPFDAKAYPDLMLRIITAEAPPIARFRSDVPAEVCTLVERMLAKHPNHRPQSCAEIEHVLRPFIGDRRMPALVTDGITAPARPAARTLPLSPSTPIPSPSPEAAPAEQRSSRPLLLVALAVCGLLLAGLMTFAIAMFWPGGGASERVAPMGAARPPEPPSADPTPAVPPPAPTETAPTAQAPTGTVAPTTESPVMPPAAEPTPVAAQAADEPATESPSTRERGPDVSVQRHRSSPETRPLAPSPFPGSSSPGRTRDGAFSRRRSSF